MSRMRPRGQLFDGPLQVRLAQVLPPHVDGAELLQGVFQAAGLVVDHRVGAQLATHLQFLVGAGRGNHAGADRAGHLHHAGGHAAAAAMHEDVFADLQLRMSKQAQVRGNAHQGDGGGVALGDILGNDV